MQENAYSPFGLTMAGISSKAAKPGMAENKWGFNGGNELQNKEFSDGIGLDWYDATNRMYDPQIGRFFQIDEFGEAAEEWSPYVFASNNPISRNDPFGLKDTAVNESHPNELIPVVVKSYSTNQKKQLYWELRNGNIDISKVENSSLRYWLENYDDVQRYMDRVHQMTREQDEIVLEAASWLIPETEILKLLKLKKLVALFKLKRGLTEIKVVRSVGAAAKGFDKVLQTGGHTLNKSTLKALGLAKEEGKVAIEALKKDIGLPSDFHGKIMGNGDIRNSTGDVLGNLFDYLP